MEERLAQDASSDVSKLGYYGAVTVEDPYALTIASTEANPIQWLSSGRTLNVGTLGGEYSAQGTADTILSNAAANIQSQTTHGCAPIQPKRVNQATLFVSRDGKRVREYLFDFNSDSYTAKNLSLLSDEIITHLYDPTSKSDTFSGTEIKEIVFQESRGILWCLTSKGALLGLTIDNDSNILAWHKHTIGGSDVNINGLTIISNSDGTFDDLWLNVERTVNSTTEHYLEKIGDDFGHALLDNTSTDLDDQPWFMDSAIKLSLPSNKTFVDGDVTIGTENINISTHNYTKATRVRLTTTGALPTGLAPATDYFIIKVDANNIKLAATRGDAINGIAVDITAASGGGTHTVEVQEATFWNGLSHLEGEDLEILADGFVVPGKTVSSGEIELVAPAKTVIAGIKYIPILKTLRIEAGGDFGTSQGQIKRIDEATIRFHKSYGAKIAKDDDAVFEELIFRPGGLGMGDPLPMYSGDIAVKYSQSPDTKGQLVIKQDLPLPINIICIIFRGVSYD
jgi:hypothetical protein